MNGSEPGLNFEPGDTINMDSRCMQEQGEQQSDYLILSYPFSCVGNLKGALCIRAIRPKRSGSHHNASVTLVSCGIFCKARES